MIDDVSMLGPEIRPLLEDASTRVILHQASCWEIQIKFDLGKLPLKRPPREIVTDGLRAHAVEYHPFQDADIWHLGKMPQLHSDPFDRILISHALCEGLRLATPDPAIHKYPVATIW